LKSTKLHAAHRSVSAEHCAWHRIVTKWTDSAVGHSNWSDRRRSTQC